MGIPLIIFLILLSYFLYDKVFKIYYTIWFYNKQGVFVCPRPLPILGNALQLAKAFTSTDIHSRYPMVEFMDDNLGLPVPKLAIYAIAVNPIIVISDPVFVNELYITKNKYFDKHLRIKT
jgi:hypothetical protein